MAVADPPKLVVPSVDWAPPSVGSRMDEAREVAAEAGIVLDPWQDLALARMLGTRADGKWSAFEAGLNVPRQNGKGGALEVRVLAGLFAFEERMQIWSAHMFDTSLEAFRRLLDHIEDTPEFDKQVKRVARSHGEEGIEFTRNRRIRFRTRTKGGGRGFSGDLLVLDEAMVISAGMHGALLPTMSARPNPQVIYAGSAVDQDIHEHGVVFARVRERAMRGGDESLAYVEWSADPEVLPDEVPPELLDDPEAWARANPSMGIRIGERHVEAERRSMDARTFAVERLGIGDWPETDPEKTGKLDLDKWRGLLDKTSSIPGTPCFAVDVKPDRSKSAIAVAGTRADGLHHVEITDHERGTEWVAQRCKDLVTKHGGHVVLDTKGPAGSLLPALAKLEVPVYEVTAAEHAQACGVLHDLVEQGRLRHLGTTELDAAVAGATERPLGDAWAWSRKSSAVDISPLVACTLAVWEDSKTVAPEPLVAWR